MKILFIDPLGDKETTGLNIGIAYCATRAFNDAHEVSILDLVNIRKDDPLKAMRNAVDKFCPDVIGISVCNITFNSTKNYVNDLRGYFNGLIVLGGPEISALGKRTFDLIPGIDMVIVGEGEITLTELLNAVKNNSDMSRVDGLIWKNGKDVIVNNKREFIKDLDEVVFPNYNLFGVDKMDVYPIVTSRGCPYGCSFCFSYLGKKWRRRTPENIIKELKEAKDRYGIKLFHICDPAFNIDIGHVERFCKLLIDEKIDMPWVIQGFRADRVTDNMMKSLQAARCRRLFVGVETLEEDVFSKINKGETLTDIKKGIAIMKKYDIEIFCYMLMGLPGDTYKKTLRSFAKAQKLNFDLLAYSSCVPFTGTAVERWVNDNANLFLDSYNVSSLGTQYDCISYETKDFTRQERIKARRILNIKSGSYNEPGLDPRLFKLKKILLILRYDFMNLHKHIFRSILYRLNYKKSVDSINLWRGIYFLKLPDGTWSSVKDMKADTVSSKRYYFDMKRLTMSEIKV